MRFGLDLSLCSPQKIIESPFDPSSISNLELFLDATDAGTISLRDSAYVTGWNDKSGQGNHFTQGVEADQPVMGANEIGFLPVLKFLTAGANYIFSDGTGSHDGLSIIAKARSPRTTSIRYLFDFGGFQTQYNLAHSATPGSGGGECPAQRTAWADSGVDTAYHVPSLVVDFPGAEIIYRMDNVQLAQNTITITNITSANIGEAPTRGTTTGPMTVGAKSTTGDPTNRAFGGYLEKLLIYTKKLTFAELTSLQNYLA